MKIIIKSAEAYQEYRVKKTVADLRSSSSQKTVDLAEIPSNTVIYSVQVNPRDMILSAGHVLLTLTENLFKNVDVSATGPMFTKPWYLHGGLSPLNVQATLSAIPLVYWNAAAKMNYVRANIGACGALTNGLAFGGYNGAGMSSTEEYVNALWLVRSALSTNRFNMGGLGTATAALSAGGTPSSTPVATVEIYNGVTWATGPSLGTARQLCGAAGVITAGLVFGGLGSANQQLASTELFDGTSWTGGPSLNTARTTRGCGVQTAALAVGGGGASGYLATVEVFNGIAWAFTGSLTAVVNNHAVFGSVTSAVSAGGNNSNLAEVFNGTTWSPTVSMNQSRNSPGGLGIGSAGMVAGGRLSSLFFNSAEIFSSTGTVGELDELPDTAELEFLFKCISFA